MKRRLYNRKTMAFLVANAICAVAAYKYQMPAHLAALVGFIFAVYTGAISAEKIILKYIEHRYK